MPGDEAADLEEPHITKPAGNDRSRRSAGDPPSEQGRYDQIDERKQRLPRCKLGKQLLPEANASVLLCHHNWRGEQPPFTEVGTTVPFQRECISSSAIVFSSLGCSRFTAIRTVLYPHSIEEALADL